MSDQPRVAVVVPTWNGGARLGVLLEAIRAQEGPFAPHVVAIDSGSTDGTIALLEHHGATILSVAPADFNHGETRNAALKTVAAEFAVLMVQDAVPDSTTWLARLVQPIQDDPSVAGTWARQRPRADASRLTAFYLSQWFGSRAEPRAAGPITPDAFAALTPAERHELCAFDNVCACLRVAVWREHPFRPTPIAEDIEWAQRVLQAGYRLVFVPDAVVVHSHDRSPVYELRRTRLAHARLHRLFGLSTVPSLPSLARSVATCIPLHLGLAADEPRHRVRAMARALGLAVAWPLGQYLGARDSRAGRVSRGVRGV